MGVEIVKPQAINHRVRNAEAVLPAAAARGSKDFLVVVYPTRWSFHVTERDADKVPSAGEWLPMMTTLPLDPGCGNIPQPAHPSQPPDPTPAIVQINRKGGIVLQPGDPRLPERFREFVHRFNCVGGAKVYKTIFESVKVYSPTKWRWETDSVAMRDFCRSLVECGIVPPLDEGLREDQCGHRQERLERIEGRYGANATGGNLTKLTDERARLRLMTDSEIVQAKPEAKTRAPSKKMKDENASLKAQIAQLQADALDTSDKPPSSTKADA